LYDSEIGIALLNALLLVGSRFFGRKELFVAQFWGPLERRDGSVGPNALQVGMAVGRARRSPILGGHVY
jgi:hypothetical protein